MIENVDYELIPEGTELWHVRFLSGDFVETVFFFKGLELKEDCMSFNFEIHSSPDSALTPENEDLQKAVGEVLYSILDNEKLEANGEKQDLR